MDVTIDRYVRRSRLAKAMIDDVILESQLANLACDAEELVKEGLEIGRLSENCFKIEYARLFSGSISDVVASGRQLAYGLSLAKSAIHQIVGFASSMKALGHSIQDVSELEAANAALDKQISHFQATWPKFDDETAKISREHILCGRYQDVSELLGAA